MVHRQRRSKTSRLLAKLLLPEVVVVVLVLVLVVEVPSGRSCSRLPLRSRYSEK